MDIPRHFIVMNLLEIMCFKSANFPNCLFFFSQFFLYPQLGKTTLFSNFNFINY